jgi:hypothetical protein
LGSELFYRKCKSSYKIGDLDLGIINLLSWDMKYFIRNWILELDILREHVGFIVFLSWDMKYFIGNMKVHDKLGFGFRYFERTRENMLGLLFFSLRI